MIGNHLEGVKTRTVVNGKKRKATLGRASRPDPPVYFYVFIESDFFVEYGFD